MNFKKNFTFLLISLLLMSCKHSDTQWDVIMVGLPPSNSNTMAMSTSASYLIAQTHEPLFRSGENGSLYSNLLKSWSRSSDSKNYTLCPISNLEFKPKVPFTTKELIESLQSIIRDNNGTIKATDECVFAFFEKEQPLFLEKLRNYEYAPQVSTDDANWKIGLGQYFIDHATKEEIFLTAKNPPSHAFKTIRVASLQLIESTKDFDYDKIEDFNRIPYEQVPETIKSKYQRYPAPLLKTHGLLFNISDKETRSSLASCLDFPKLRDAFFPALENGVNLESILPLGIDGAIEKKDFSKTKCNTISSLRKRKLVFANWKHSRSLELRKYFELLKKKSGINIEVKDIAQSDLIKMLYGRHEGYDLIILGLDTSSDEYTPFFEPFLGTKKRVHKLNMDTYKSLYTNLTNASSKEQEKRIAVEIDLKIRKDSIFLPIAQDFRTFVFPDRIKGFNIGKNFIGNIEIGQLYQ